MSGGIPYERLRVVAEPEPASHEDYRRAASELETALAELPGALAVYRLGGVGAPGISDLDRVLVIEDGEPVPPTVWPHLSPETRALAMHTPFLADRRTFARHRWFAHLEGLELASGRAVEAEEPPEPGYLATLHGAEGLLLRLMELRRQLYQRRVKARSLLCSLHSLRFSLKLAGLGVDTAPRADALVDATDQLRREWFEDRAARRHERLRALIAAAGPAVAEAMAALPPAPAPAAASLAVRGAGPWRNVTIEAAERGDAGGISGEGALGSGLAGRSRALGELLWRARARRMTAPGRVIGWLQCPAAGPERSARARRDEIVADYLSFAEQGRAGWSTLGFADSFRPE